MPERKGDAALSYGAKGWCPQKTLAAPPMHSAATEPCYKGQGAVLYHGEALASRSFNGDI